MARPSNPPFTLGKISVRAHPTRTGDRQARGYYIDGNRIRREVTASGKSDAAAKRSLQAKAIAAREQFRGGDSLLSSETRLDHAADVWLDWKRREKKGGKALSPQTLKDYEGYVNRSVKGSSLAALMLADANSIGRIEGWL